MPSQFCGGGGSTTIYFAPTKPSGVKDGNWVQTVPGKAGSFYYASMARWNPSSRRNGARARSNSHGDVFRGDLQARRDDPISGSRTRSTYRACATDGRQRHLSVGFPNERRNIASLNLCRASRHHRIGDIPDRRHQDTHQASTGVRALLVVK